MLTARVHNTTCSLLQEQKVAAVQVKKEAVDKRKRIDEAIESSDDEEVTVIRSRDRKRYRGADEEVIALDEEFVLIMQKFVLYGFPQWELTR